jgi:hypothetical protein
MAVSITLHQVRTVEEGPVYQVYNEITESDNISDKLFVFTTATDTFSRVATVFDVLNVPDSKGAAETADADFYRESVVTFSHSEISTAVTEADRIITRLKNLAHSYNKAQEDFLSDETTVIEAS